MMTRFTLALLPTQAEDKAFFSRAAASFQEKDEGLLFGQGIDFPHVALCAFQAPSEKEAAAGLSPFAAGVFSVAIEGVFLSPLPNALSCGRRTRIAYAVRRHPALRLLQERAEEHLRTLGFETQTGVEDSFTPSLTLSIASALPVALDGAVIAPELWGREIPCSFAIGAIDNDDTILRLVPPVPALAN